MFLNTPMVKKLFKRAFNTTGLVISRPDEELICIEGSKWEIEMDYECMPLKQKAALIELIGEIPAVGKCLVATKKDQQFKLLTKDSLRDCYMCAKVLVQKVPIAIERPYFEYQLFQEQESKEFLAVDRELVSMIDIREIDFENEGMPCGPCREFEGNHLYWHNGAGTLALELEEMDKEALRITNMLDGLQVKKEE